MRPIAGLVMLLQASSYGPPFPSSSPAAGTAEPACAQAARDEIVVCKRSSAQSAYRLRPLEPERKRTFGLEGPGGSSLKGGSFTNARGTEAAGIRITAPF